MSARFACLDCIESMEELEYKYQIIKKSPHFVLDWYVKTYNPYKMESICICGVDGWHVKIPMTLESVQNNLLEAEEIVRRTLDDLKYRGAVVVYPNPIFNQQWFDDVLVCNGKTTFLLLMMDVIRKALEIRGKALKHAEILVIDGGEKTKVDALIDVIFPHINGLTVISEREDGQDLLVKAADIFSDTGLTMIVGKKNRFLMENADVIINTSDQEDRYDFYYKRGAIYLELSNHPYKAKELASKRLDMFVADSVTVLCEQTPLNLDLFETLWYTKSHAFRSFFQKGYRQSLVQDLCKELRSWQLKIQHFSLSGKLTSIGM